jgi:alpha-glucoside transport system substrate-binding protein
MWIESAPGTCSATRNIGGSGSAAGHHNSHGTRLGSAAPRMRARHRVRAGSVFIAAIAVAAGSLTACSPTAEGDEAVTILGAFSSTQAKAFQDDLDAWAESQGVKTRYSGSSNFQQAIVTRVTAGDPPDIAIYPQPGILRQHTEHLVPLEDLVDVPAVVADEPNGLGEIARVDGKTFGLPYSINVKSLVWYNPSAFKEHGYTVPQTGEELTQLTEQIKSDGAGYPWCIGIESEGATGWVATDWLEEYVLRYGGLEQYNAWIAGDLPFDSPLVTKAAEKFGSIALDEGNVNGGGKAIVTTSFRSVGNQLFVSGKDQSQCFMMRQGTFIADLLPDDIKAEVAQGDNSHVNVFPLPSPSDAVTTAAIGGGDLVGAFNDAPATQKVVEYLVSKEFGTNGYAGQTAFLSPHASFDTTLYTSPFQAAAQEAVSQAETFGFDASDQMPGEVGSGSEWTELVAWLNGEKPLDEALGDIDASWPDR